MDYKEKPLAVKKSDAGTLAPSYSFGFNNIGNDIVNINDSADINVSLQPGEEFSLSARPGKHYGAIDYDAETSEVLITANLV